MRRLVVPLSVLATLAAIAVGGCNEDSGADNGLGDHQPAPLPASTGGELGYPPGPYSINKGSIIDNFTFDGFPNAKASSAAVVPIHLADFYNPHADDAGYAPADAAHDDRLFPPGSPYGGGKSKPRAVLIDIASVWCSPCNQEAKSVLPGLHAKFAPCGGEFLFQLAQGATPGSAATESNLRGWTTKYKVDYPATIDPAQQLTALYGGSSFPDSAIIDTRTMRIVEVISGVPEDGFWSEFQDAIGNPACFAGK